MKNIRKTAAHLKVDNKLKDQFSEWLKKQSIDYLTHPMCKAPDQYIDKFMTDEKIEGQDSAELCELLAPLKEEFIKK